MPRLVIAKWYRRSFDTVKVEKLMPKIPYKIPDEPIKVRGGRNLEYLRQKFGHQMRLKTIAKTVNELIDQERLELAYFRGYEVRNYTERLIAEAMRYGDCHKPTMELANFYLGDKTLIHKLFKVLVPRYLNYTTAFTSMHLLPTLQPDWSDSVAHNYTDRKVVVELKGNPYPPIRQRDSAPNPKELIHNILLEEASKEYYRSKSAPENDST